MNSGVETTEGSGDSDEFSSSKEKKSYPCTYNNCSATFSKNSKLVYHIRRHTGERPFACDVPNCNKTYFYSYHLRRHKESHTNKAEHEAIPCPVEGCFLELANKHSLKKHMKRKHNPERSYPFTCETCKQGFHRKKHLLHHSYIHTGTPSFECSICSTKFRILRDLNRHRRTHTKYSCDCGEKYERWTTLLAHKKDCPTYWHQCTFCEKKFKQKTNLNSHMSTHMEVAEKFICGYDDCGRSYLYKKNLVQHIKRYHKKIVKKIVCPMYGDKCKQTFSKNQNLKYHMRRFHSDQKSAKKTVKKPRKDKGVSRESMAALLAGLPLPRRDHLSVIKGLPIELPHLVQPESREENLIVEQSKLILRNCGSESDACEDNENEYLKIVC